MMFRLLRTLGLAVGVALWAAVFVAPLIGLFWAPPGTSVSTQGAANEGLWRDFGASCLWAGAIATVAVVAGYLPGRLLGQASASRSRGRQVMLLAGLLLPLLLPNYVLYYAWAMLLAPQTALGGMLESSPVLHRHVYAAVGSGSLMLWYWPLAALLMAQGWRGIDSGAIEQARLDANPWSRLLRVHLPLMAGSIAIAFLACFVLTMSEFTTFHLSQVNTIGARLAVLLHETGDVRTVARASLPVAAPAVLAAVLLWRVLLKDRPEAAPLGAAGRTPAWQWVLAGLLLGLSCLAPIGLLLAHLDWTPIKRFLDVQSDELECSFYVSALAAAISVAMAWVALEMTAAPRAEPSPQKTRRRFCAPYVGMFMQLSLLLTMLLPPVLLAGGLSSLVTGLELYAVRDSLVIVSLGLALRYAGLAMIVLHFARRGLARDMTDLADVDGASRWQTFWHVSLPHQWPTLAGAAIVVMMMGITEIPATMLLLPAGVPNFAQHLLDQMHAVRQQDVIASCTVLVGSYLAVAAAAVAGAMVLSRRSVSTRGPG